MPGNIRWLWIIILILFCNRTLAQYPYSYSFNERHGFPINEIYYLYQDKKGSIWIGSNDGIFRYSNGNFKQFTHPERNSRGISHIIEDRYGRIWCQNFTRQIFCIDGDSMRLAFDASAYVTTNPPFDVDSDGNLYVGGYKSFMVVGNDHNVRKVMIPGMSSLAEIFHDRDGSVLMVADKIYRWKDGRLNTIEKTNRPDLLGIFGQGSTKIDYLGDRLLLYNEVNSDRSYYLSRIIGDSIVITSLPDSLTQGRINNLGLLHDGRIWLNTQNGTICVDSNLHPVYGAKFFFPGNNVSDIMIDAEGNYWVSTLESGIHIIPNIGIWQYTRSNSKLADNNVTSLYTDNSGLYVGYFNGRVDVIRNGKFEKSFFDSDNRYQLVEKMARRDGNGLLYISHGLMSIYNERTGRMYDIGPGIHGMKSFVFTGPGELLYVTNVGAGMLRTRNDVADSNWYLRQSTTRCVAYNAREKVKWAGYTDGVYYEDSNGSQKELLYKSAKIYAICMTLEDDGVLWIGTVNGNLLKVKDRKIIDVFSERKNLHGKNVRVIYQSGKQLWVATEKGLNIIDTFTGKATYIDTHDGLPAMEINDMLVNDNLVYLATTKGLFVFSQYIRNTNDTRPGIALEKLLVNDKPYTAGRWLALGPRENKLSFYFRTDGVGEKYEYSYRYKLEGYDTAWQQTAQNINIVSYSSLPPGTYTFYAKTVNEDGFESLQAYSVGIMISKPFWQRWWFYLLVGIAGALLVSLVFLGRIRALKRKNKLQQLIRSSQLTALKAQMNPHFVFNALNSIQDFVLRNDIKNANLYLGRFSELMRKVLEASGKESIPLEQEIDILNLYLDMEKLRFGTSFSYSLETDSSVDTSSLYIPAMIIQPFIENAIKHGLLHKEGAKRLDVHFTKPVDDANHIICTIEDNGVGRKRAIEIKERNKDIRTNGFAIKATEKRLDLLNSYYKEKIGVVITDMSKDGVATGTRVRLSIPCYSYPVDEPV